MDMHLSQLKLKTSNCVNENYQSLTIDMAKGKLTERYRLELNSLFVTGSCLFKLVNRVFFLR